MTVNLIVSYVGRTIKPMQSGERKGRKGFLYCEERPPLDFLPISSASASILPHYLLLVIIREGSIGFTPNMKHLHTPRNNSVILSYPIYVLTVFSIEGPKKNAGHFWHLFLIQFCVLFHMVPSVFLAVEEFLPIRKWLKKLPWKVESRVPCERA